MVRHKGERNIIPMQPKSSGVLEKGEFMVPVEQQQILRDLDNAGSTLQRQLGLLEINYIAQKNEILVRFRQNRVAYESSVKEVAKKQGVDFEKVQERWDFDFSTMTCRRIGQVVAAVPALASADVAEAQK